MADISKCCDTQCPSREKCFRYRVKPAEFRQSYAPFRHALEDGRCNEFLPLSGWANEYLIPEGAIVKDFLKEDVND